MIILTQDQVLSLHKDMIQNIGGVQDYVMQSY